MGNSTLISSLLVSIFSALDALVCDLDKINPSEASIASSQLARLKLWSARLKPHQHDEPGFIKYRLRDASSANDHIISILEGISFTATEAATLLKNQPSVESLSFEDQSLGPVDDELAHSISEDGNVKAPATYGPLDDIKHSIDCLFRLTIIMRSPDSHSPSLSGHGRVSGGSEALDLRLVQKMFPEIGDVLEERLQTSLSLRREHLRRRREDSSQPSKALDASVGITQSKATGKSLTDEVLVISRVSAREDSDTLQVPPLPEAFATGPSQCPLCCSVVLIGHNWKTHILNDIQPYLYVCVVEDCLMPDKFYSHRGDWEQHMRLDHWRLWKCPFGCPHEFHTAEELLEHSSSTHGDEITERYYSNLVQLCSVSDLSKAIGKCPLCSHQIASDRLYMSHVVAHLETLALDSLSETLLKQTDKGKRREDSNIDHANRSPDQVDDDAIEPLPLGEDAESDGCSDAEVSNATLREDRYLHAKWHSETHQDKRPTSSRKLKAILRRLLPKLIMLEEMIARGRKLRTSVKRLRSRRLAAFLRRLSKRRGE